MKRNHTLILAIAIIFLTSGCKKKSDPTPEISSNANNGFNLKGVFYSTPTGVYIHAGDSLFDFMFHSNSITFNHAEQAWAGTGNTIEISELVTGSVQNHMPYGTYIYRHNSAPGSFTDGGTAMGYSFDQDTGYMVFCVSGSVTISHAGTQILLSYTFHNEDSTVVTGSFTGNPQDITSWIQFRKKRR